MQEHVDGCAEYSVSDREIDRFENMVETFFEFMKDADLIDDEGELDRDMLSQICLSMKMCER